MDNGSCGTTWGVSWGIVNEGYVVLRCSNSDGCRDYNNIYGITPQSPPVEHVYICFGLPPTISLRCRLLIVPYRLNLFGSAITYCTYVMCAHILYGKLRWLLYAQADLNLLESQIALLLVKFLKLNRNTSDTYCICM